VSRISAIEHLIASAHPIFPTIANDTTTAELIKPYRLPASIVAGTTNIVPKAQPVMMTIQPPALSLFFLRPC